MKSSVGHTQEKATTAMDGWPMSVQLQVANRRAFPVAVNSALAGVGAAVQSRQIRPRSREKPTCR